MILRFKLNCADLRYDSVNRLLRNYYNSGFTIVFDSEVTCDISRNVVTVTSNSKFTAMIKKLNSLHPAISFESEPESVYGDRYSIDVSNLSCLTLDNNGVIGCRRGIESLTLKLYKASITNHGCIELNEHSVNNAVIYLDRCNINYTSIGLGSVDNKHNITNSSIVLKDCIINNTTVYIGNANNIGDISSSSIQLNKCVIGGNTSIDIGSSNNRGDISKSSIQLDGCSIQGGNLIIGIGSSANRGNIHNSNIMLMNHKTTNSNKYSIEVGIGIDSNAGRISDSRVILDNYNINCSNGMDVGIGVRHNMNSIFNSSVQLNKCVIEPCSVVIGIGFEDSKGKISKSDITIKDSTINSDGVFIGIDDKIDSDGLPKQKETVVDNYIMRSKDYHFNVVNRVN